MVVFVLAGTIIMVVFVLAGIPLLLESPVHHQHVFPLQDY